MTKDQDNWKKECIGLGVWEAGQRSGSKAIAQLFALDLEFLFKFLDQIIYTLIENPMRGAMHALIVHHLTYVVDIFFKQF